jgi:protein SDA1
LQKLAGEGAVAATADDESAWHGWDIESDSSDGSESGTWIDVDDAGSVAISGDESSDTEDSLTRTSTLATTKVC